MFGLRSSPSTLVVPCSLRGAVAAEAGMGFAPLRLTAPRPKRAVMPIMYYDVAGAGGGAGGVEYSPSTAAVSEYAGVFEAGCDPAQVRASLNRGSRRSATPVLEAQASQAVVATALNGKTTAAAALEAEREIATPSVTPCYDDEDHEGEEGVFEEEEEDVDCLFQLEGVKDDRYDTSNNRRRDVVVETRSNSGISKNISSSCRIGRQGGGMSAHVRRPAAPSAPNRYPSAAAVAYSARPSYGRASPAPGRRGPDLNSADVGQEEMRPIGAGGAVLRAPAAAPAEKIAPGTGAGPSAVFFKPTALRTPRVIAPPGRRCVSGGMYRLRLSTSC